MPNTISIEVVATKIFEIRGKKAMLDSDLAKLYGVRTKNLNKAVGRNKVRFPEDFMFRLTKEELESLRFHFGTSKRGGRRYLPYVFTQEGIAMLSGVLNSERAIQVNILIMRAFTKLREILISHKELAEKIDALEKKYAGHDETIKAILNAIKQLLNPKQKKKRVIQGFGG